MDIKLYIKPNYWRSAKTVELLDGFNDINSDEFYFLSSLTEFELQAIVNNDKDTFLNPSHIKLVKLLEKVGNGNVYTSLAHLFNILKDNTEFKKKCLDIFISSLVSEKMFNTDLEVYRHNVFETNVAVRVLHYVIFDIKIEGIEDLVCNFSIPYTRELITAFKFVRGRMNSAENNYTKMLSLIYNCLVENRAKAAADAFLAQFKLWFEKGIYKYIKLTKDTISLLICARDAGVLNVEMDAKFIYDLLKHKDIVEDMETLTCFAQHDSNNIVLISSCLQLITNDIYAKNKVDTRIQECIHNLAVYMHQNDLIVKQLSFISALVEVMRE